MEAPDPSVVRFMRAPPMASEIFVTASRKKFKNYSLFVLECGCVLVSLRTGGGVLGCHGARHGFGECQKCRQLRPASRRKNVLFGTV